MPSSPRNWGRKYTDTLTLKRLALANAGEVRFLQSSKSELEAANLEFLYVREREENIEVSQNISNRPTLVVAVVYFCQSKHIKNSRETLLVRFNLTPVVKTTMN